MCGGSESLLPPPFHIEVHCTIGSASRLKSNPNTGVNAGALQRPRSRLFGEMTAGCMSRLGAYTNTSPCCERYTIAPTTAWPAHVARPCGVSQCGREMRRDPANTANSSRSRAATFRRVAISGACYQRIQQERCLSGELVTGPFPEVGTVRGVILEFARRLETQQLYCQQRRALGSAIFLRPFS
jgi:hypothetical protein